MKAAIGATPSWCWSNEHEAAFRKLHPPADPSSIAEEDVEQSFRTFMGLSKRPPNERGTGRWNLTDRRRTIAVLPIGRDICQKFIHDVVDYLGAFFHGLPVELMETKDEPIEIHKTNKKSGRFVLQQRGGRCLDLEHVRIDHENHIEVFSMFDALTEFLQPHHYCIVALADRPLCETWQDDDDGTWETTVVLGRACGDRVCVVDVTSASSSNKSNLRTLLATTTHEILHCFGMDHCTTFRCLMNSQQVDGDDCLFLSPLNLKKWMVGVLGLKDSDEATTTVLERYKAMKQVLNGFGMKQQVVWLQKKIALVQKATGKIDRNPVLTTPKRKKRRCALIDLTDT